MKNFGILILLISCYTINGQTYAKENISLVSLIDPNPTPGVFFDGDTTRYAGCWGWYQTSLNKEYAISGASNGTYFIDMTNPATPTVSAFVPAHSQCTWREVKTYKHYAYIVSDGCLPNAFQIVDLQYLPDSVHVVYNDSAMFTLGHTIWIDNDKMYIGSNSFSMFDYSPMTVWSLANPEVPVLLRRLEQDFSGISQVHDMFVRNDTCYVSAAWQGMRILKFNPVTNIFTQLGTYAGYPFAGYNHSSALTQDGKHLIFCDEVPKEKPIHFINVQNLSNIQSVNRWNPRPRTTAHNPFVIGNDFAVVSSYQDGLFIYNISEPDSVKQIGYFDTYPQGGYGSTANPAYGGSVYKGNWGAYPFLPSGLIIANDMQNGVFILDAKAAFTAKGIHVGFNATVGLDPRTLEKNLQVYPNPAANSVIVDMRINEPVELKIVNIYGSVVFEKHLSAMSYEQLDVTGFASGTYFVTFSGNSFTVNKKLMVSH